MNSNLKSFFFSFFASTSLKKYVRLMRLHRPVGIFLCLWPALWSLSLSLSSLPPLRLVILFFLGATLMRSIGCLVNDFIDRHLDRQVARTKTRPLASGQLSLPQVFFILFILSSAALGLLLTFNKSTLWLGLGIVIPVILYPFFKRFTYWPQVFLGLVFNWGALMADTALHDQVSIQTVVLYLSCVFWTIGYDTLYAFQDYEDDKIVGIKSSALKVGYKRGKAFISICYLFFFVGLFFCSYWIQGTLFAICLTFMSLGVFISLASLSLKDPRSCGKFFTFNAVLGFLIWASILMTSLVK